MLSDTSTTVITRGITIISLGLHELLYEFSHAVSIGVRTIAKTVRILERNHFYKFVNKPKEAL